MPASKNSKTRPSNLYYLDRCRQEVAEAAHERFRTAAKCRTFIWPIGDTILREARKLVDSYRFYRRQVFTLPLP